MMDPYSALGYGIGMYLMSIYIVVIGTAVLMTVIYLFPFVQVLINQERIKWLKREFKKESFVGPEEENFRNKLLEAAKPEQAHPMYKLLKFYLIGAGVIAVVVGLLMVILPEYTTGGIRKFLVFIPIIVGVGLYFLYKLVYLNHGIWREIAGAFLIMGFAATAGGAYDAFDLDDWLRMDLLIYAILGFGLWVIFHLKSIVASYVYMIIVSTACSLIVTSVSENGWYFLTHFIWIFAAAIFSFWLPKLRKAKEIGFKELLFGILLFSNATSLITYNTSGLVIPGLAVMLPTLYLFSKVYYRKATWFGGKPIEVAVILFVLFSAIGWCIPSFVAETQDSITLFKHYSFHKQIAYFILIIIAICGYILYQDHEGDEHKSVNLLIVFYPVGAFILIYLVGDYGTQFIVNAFLLYLGYDYLQKGIKQKDVVQLIIAVFCIVIGLFIRLEAFIEDLDEKEIIGLIIILVGTVFISLALYLRMKWTVTAPDGEMQQLTDDFEELDA